MSPEFSVLTRAYPGELTCGDTHLIVQGQEGTVIALSDGLGHGPSAALASKAFCDFVKERPDDPLDHLIESASRALHATRGAAAALVRISRGGGVLSFCGIGNVELQAVSRQAIRPVSLPGIVGRKIRKAKTFDYPIHKGDFFALYSDGISSRVELSKYRALPLQDAAKKIVAEHGKNTDDVSVVVFRT